MKILPQFFRGVLCLAFVAFAGGCSTATNSLWQRQAYRPAKTPSIKLALDPQRRDILVRYDEQSNKSEPVKERAYWLFASADSTAAPRTPPAFLADSDMASLRHLVDVPVYRSRIELKYSSAPGYAAVAGLEDREFDLWRDGHRIQTYKLPAYSQCAGVNPLRLVLTPGAMTVDATVAVGKATFGKDTRKVMEQVGWVTLVCAYYAAPYALEFCAHYK